MHVNRKSVIQSIAYSMVGLFAALFVAPATAQQQEAIEQATTASRYSGAPMLVIAGRETCPNCQNLIKQLGQREFARMTGGMIPLKIDVDQPQWREFAGKYGRPDGATLPFVYVIRADGETLHSHSGPMETVQLANVIGTQLQRVGQPLNERQVQSINEAVEASRDALVDGNPAQAVRELLPLKRIGNIGQLGSFAESAVEADKLVAELAENVSDKLGDVPSRIDSQDDALQACFDVVQAKRIYGSIDAIDSMINPILAELRRNRELRDVMGEAAEIDRACKQCENSSTRQRGIDALQRIIDEAPDSDAAKVAATQLELFESE